LITEASMWLDRRVNAKEIHRALLDMHPKKAPGPDG